MPLPVNRKFILKEGLAASFFVIPLCYFKQLDDYFITTKWAAFLVGSFFLILLSRPRQFPFSKFSGWIFSLAIAYFSLKCLLFWPIPYWFSLTFAYALLAYTALFTEVLATEEQELGKRISQYIRAATLVLLVHGLFQILRKDFLFPELVPDGIRPFSFFGNPNFTAEFLGVSLIVQYFSLKELKSQVSRLPAFRSLMFVWTALYVVLLFGRGIWVGMAIVALMEWAKSSRLSINFKKFSFLLTGVLLLILLLPGHSSGDLFRLFHGKWLDTFGRAPLWLNSLALTKAHPWGVGPNQFGFAYVPFSNAVLHDGTDLQTTLMTSPHNELLHLAIEYGWDVVGIFLLSVLFLIYRAQKDRSPYRIINSWRKTLQYSAIVLGIDSLFNPTFSNPFCVLWCVYVATALLPHSCSPALPSKFLRWGASFAALVLFLTIPGWIGVRWIEANAINHIPKNQWACRLFPSEPLPCIRVARSYLDFGNASQGKKSLETLLRHHPYYFPAQKYLIYSLFALGDKKPACQSLIRYDALFSNQSQVHKAVSVLCESPGDPLEKNRPLLTSSQGRQDS